MDERAGKIVFNIGAALLALVSGIMLFSSILLVGSPELATQPHVLAEWEVSSYTFFWGFIFIGAVLSAIWINILPKKTWLFKAGYFFLITFPVFWNIYNIYYYHDWMSPATDALKSWSGVSFGSSPWILAAVLLILHQIWKLGYHLWLEESNEDNSDFTYNPLYYVIRSAFNIAILVVFIPILNFFNWANQPPMFSMRMFFILNIIIYIVYLLFRKNLTARSPVLLIIYNVVFFVLMVALYAYLNSAAFDWLFNQLTNNPIVQLLLPLFIFGGNGVKVGEGMEGNVKVTYYVPSTMAPGELASTIAIAAAVLILTPIFYVTDTFSIRTAITEFRESAQERIADPEFAREMNMMNTIRRADSFRQAAPIDTETVKTNKAALEAFTENNVSYRIKVEQWLGKLDTVGKFPDTSMYEIETSYNHEIGVYKFVVQRASTVNIFLGGGFENYRIKEGTYYIVSENGKTYILSEIDGKKAVIDIAQDRRLYDLLMRCTMKSVSLDFALNPEAENYFWRDGYFYTYEHEWYNIVFYNDDIVRAYNDKPVYCRYSDFNGVQWHCLVLDFYYFRIPDDNPSVADWK